MSRPKILHVNEGVAEALFYLYNVLVKKVVMRLMILCQKYVFLMSLRT